MRDQRVGNFRASRIDAALSRLPAECKYHGSKIYRGSTFPRDICCDTGRATEARQVAEEALGEILAEVDRLRAEAIRYKDERDVAEGEVQQLGVEADRLRAELASYGEPETEYGHMVEAVDGRPCEPFWLSEPRGRNYATVQRSARFGPAAPVTEANP